MLGVVLGVSFHKYYKYANGQKFVPMIKSTEEPKSYLHNSPPGGLKIEGRGCPLGGIGPICSENFGGGLYPSVDVHWLKC